MILSFLSPHLGCFSHVGDVFICVDAIYILSNICVFFQLAILCLFLSCTCSLCLKLLVMLSTSERYMQSVTLCFQLDSSVSSGICSPVHVLIPVNHTLNHFCLYHLIEKLKNNHFKCVIFKNIKGLYLENKTVSLTLM